jgi:hypothetical protein
MHVGEVWLCGTLPGWEPPWFAFGDLETYPVTADPLVLPPAAWLATELAGWDSDEWVEAKRPWRFGFAPDDLHKAGISGGTHDIVLPAATADPLLLGVEYRDGVTLVEYLRASLAHGGFAGAEFMPAPPPLLAEISAELVPFLGALLAHLSTAVKHGISVFVPSIGTCQHPNTPPGDRSYLRSLTLRTMRAGTL